MTSAFDSLLAEADDEIMGAFAETVQIVASGETVQGIFDMPTGAATLSRGSRVADASVHLELDHPLLTVTAADAVKLPEHAEVRIRGELYRVHRARPDGGGLVAVALAELETAGQPPQAGEWR